MRNNKIIISIICLCLFLISDSTLVRASGTVPSTWDLVSQSVQEQSRPEANEDNKLYEILNNFAVNQDKVISFAAKVEESVDIIETWGENANYHYDVIIEAAFDEKRASSRIKSWGDINPTFKPTKEKPQYQLRLFDGTDSYQYDTTPPSKGSLILIQNNAVNRPESLKTFIASNTLGYFPLFDKERIDATIRNADSAKLRNQMEKIGDSDCHVIEARAKTGSYTIWIDPNHGYNIAKAELIKKPGDEFPNGVVLPENDGQEYFMDNIRFEKVQDIWLAMEYDVTTERYNLSKEKIHYTITEFILNPDHEVLGSFEPNDIADGAKVRVLNMDGGVMYPIQFVWQDGKIVDSMGREFSYEYLVSQSLIEKTPKQLVGKPLPSLNEFNVRLDGDVIANKMLLICFWDMNQRPSRNAIQTLNKRAQTLLDNSDVYMVFIHAGAVEEQKIVSWLKRNEIQPPVGVSRDGLPELGYTWGVQSLPWLILTDKNHVVTDEGFSINELDEKITSSGRK